MQYWGPNAGANRGSCAVVAASRLPCQVPVSAPYKAQLRHFAAPAAIPVAIKACLKLAKGPVGRIAMRAAVYLLRWWPYYLLKFTAVKAVQKFGAAPVYRHAIRATDRLITDRQERRRAQMAVESLLRMPSVVQSRALTKLADIDGFLLRWAEEVNHPPTLNLDMERQLRSDAKHIRSALHITHSMQSDMSPSFELMQVYVRMETARSVATRLPLPGPRYTMPAFGPGMTVLGFKCLLEPVSGVSVDRQFLTHLDGGELADSATMMEAGVVSGTELRLTTR